LQQIKTCLNQIMSFYCVHDRAHSSYIKQSCFLPQPHKVCRPPVLCCLFADSRGELCNIRLCRIAHTLQLYLGGAKDKHSYPSCLLIASLQVYLKEEPGPARGLSRPCGSLFFCVMAYMLVSVAAGVAFFLRRPSSYSSV